MFCGVFMSVCVNVYRFGFYLLNFIMNRIVYSMYFSSVIWKLFFGIVKV